MSARRSVRSAAAVVAALTVSALFSAAAQAAPGDLDPSFSGDGKQITDFGAIGVAYGVALQGDGKIVAVGGGLGTDGTDDFTLARYLGG